MFTHLQNQADIDYLYRYYRGDQPILYREKEVRPEINNMVVENRANEIVSFKTGYLVGEPVQYVSRGGDSAIATEVLRLNDYMLSEDKQSKLNILRLPKCGRLQPKGFRYQKLVSEALLLFYMPP